MLGMSFFVKLDLTGYWMPDEIQEWKITEENVETNNTVEVNDSLNQQNKTTGHEDQEERRVPESLEEAKS